MSLQAADVERGHTKSEDPPPARGGSWGAWAALGALLLSVAATGASFLVRHSPPEGPRGIEARLTQKRMDAYRPFDEKARPSAAPIPSGKSRPAPSSGGQGLLGAEEFLELGMAPEAELALSKLPASPDANNARAVTAMLRGQSEQALTLLDAVLAADANHAQAGWNRALLLSDIGLQASAAKAFSQIAAKGEKGWSGEALERSKALEGARHERTVIFAQARATMFGEGPLKPLPGTTPSQLRHLFYEVLRTAESAEAVTRLQPLAANFSDRAGLDSEAKRVTALNLEARKPNVAAYRALIEAAPPPARAEQDALLSSWRKAGELPLIAGAALHLGREADLAEDLRAQAKGQRDPWQRAMADLAEAKAERARGDNAAAERRLKPAVTACNLSALDYPCARLEIQLAAAQGAMGQQNANHKVLDGLRRALRAKLTPFEPALFEEAAEASRAAGAPRVAAAIAEEAKFPLPPP